MTPYQTAMAQSCRKTHLRATMTLQTGYAYPLTGSDILSFSLSEGVSGGVMLLGSAVSAHGTLMLCNKDGAWQEGGTKLGTRSLQGATVQVEVGVETSSGVIFEPAGCFIVSDIRIRESEDAIVLSGYEMLVHRFAAPFDDQITYPCTLKSLFAAIVSQSGCIYIGQPACNGDVLLAQKPAWSDGCTLRQAMAHVAGAMGCFVRLNRQGLITLLPINPQTSERILSPDRFTSLSFTPGAFCFNRLRIVPRGTKSSEIIESALDDALPAAADNLLTIENNPVFRAGAAELQQLSDNLCAALRGLTLTAFEGELPGDPTLQIGDPLIVCDCMGKAHLSLLTSQQLTFDAGFTAEISCEADVSGIAAPRVFTPGGLLTSAALTDGVIASRHLKAGSVDAEKITARAITAEHIAMGTLTAESGVIGDLSADLVTSGKLHTDRLIIGGTEFSIVRALNQLANRLSENNSTIDGDVLSDKTISAVKVTDDFGAGLELSSNAAVLLLAGKLDGTHSHMELTEDAINMVGGEINIATDDMEIRGINDGEEIMSLDPDGLSADRVVVRRHFSAPNAVLKHLSAVIPWCGGIQQSLDSAPHYLTEDALLTVPAGVYREDVRIRGFVGAKLTLLFSEGATLIGTVTVSDCSRVTLEAQALGDGCIYPDSAKDTVVVDGSACLTLKNLYISGYRERTGLIQGSTHAVLVRGGCCHIDGCGLEYADYGALFTDSATGFVQNTRGGQSGADPLLNCNLLYGLYAKNGAHVAATGTTPMGGTNATGSELATMLTGEITPTAGGMEYVPPSEVTKTFALTSQCTYRQNKTIGSDLRQGLYGEYAAKGWGIASMWFAEATNALKDRKIIRATLTLRRAVGGSSAPVNAYFGTVPLTAENYDSTTWPAFTKCDSLYPGEKIAREGEMTYDVTELMPAVQQGHALALHEPIKSYTDDHSPAYAIFYGLNSGHAPVLTVTYGSNEQPDADVAFTQNDDGSVTLTNTTFTKLDDSTVQMDNATFTQQDDGSVLVQ